MRQILLASLAVLSAAARTPPAPPSPSCEPACEEGKACRFGIGSNGQSCTTESVCVDTVKRGEFCSEANAEKSCFSGTCADGLTCRERSTPEGSIQGICVATCKVGEKVWKEGETIPGAGDKWCNKQRCGSDGTFVSQGDKECPVAKDLKCCAGKPPKGKKNACCGTTGLWVLKDKDGRWECAGVVTLPITDETLPEDNVRVTPVAPFAHGCLDACGEGMDEGWEGTSPKADQFCNTCRCGKRELTCTTRDCSKELQCCDEDLKKEDNEKCCGATGKWVMPDGNKYLCAGQKYKGKVSTSQMPFAKACVTSCVVGDETIESGTSIRHPDPAQWCNQCKCKKGVAECTKEKCDPKLEDLKCCPPSKRGGILARQANVLDEIELVCCGINGEWVVSGVEDCGTQVAGRAGVAPITSACRNLCRPNPTIGGPTEDVPVGWTGPKTGAEATLCDTCHCSMAKPLEVCEDKKLPNGDVWRPVQAKFAHIRCPKVEGHEDCNNKKFNKDKQTIKIKDACCACGGGIRDKEPAVTCTTTAKADCTIGCCPSAAPGSAEDYACCGISKKWVKKAADGTFTCGAHVTKSVDGEPFAKECEKTCKHTGAKDDAAAYLYTGWSGKDWGTNWCNMCRCKADGLACTTHACKKRCCPKDDKPTDGSPVCCAATGKWIVPNSDGDLKCAHVVFKAGEDIGPVGEECSDPAVPEQCTSDPVRNVGWRGAGTGADWCKTCKCAVVEDAPKYTCAGPVCPEQADLLCCDPALEPTDKDKRACCGITGDWVTTDADDITCGPVTIPHAADLAAPFNKACPTCSVTGLDDPVAVGWMGLERTAEKWCTKCHCIAKGGAAELACAARDCGELKCCAGAAPVSGDWACCGKTGEWVKKNGADFTCDSVVSSKTDLPPFADKCADDAVCTDDEFDTPLAPGTVAWIGDDNCKMCHCSADKKLTCRPARCVPLPP